jgi:pimeloyl-ACP methyl ester carboxylesterase
MNPPVAEFGLVDADGRAFHVTEEGEGAAVLLVHGGSNGPGDWDRVAGDLAKRHAPRKVARIIGGFVDRVIPKTRSAA